MKWLLGLFRWVVKQITYKQRIEEMLFDVQKRVLKVEIEQNMQRGDIKAVHEVGDIYLERGYNSYMRERLLNYYKEHPIKE
jgi:hypothetical protein